MAKYKSTSVQGLVQVVAEAQGCAKRLSCCDGELEEAGMNSDEVVMRCVPNGKGILDSLVLDDLGETL